MSTDLVERPVQGVVQEGPTLAELAATANREHGLVLEAGGSMVEHAIRAGDALIQARECYDGEWLRWLEVNFDASHATAVHYMKVAFYGASVRGASGVDSIARALLYLRGLPGPYAGTGRISSIYPQEMEVEAQRLHSAGASFAEIGRLLGVSPTTAHHWCDPGYKERQRQLKATARKANRVRRQQEQDAERERAVKRAVRKAGGAIAEAYSMAERMDAVLAQAHRETEDREARRALSEAGAHYRKMRDEIVRALGVS